MQPAVFFLCSTKISLHGAGVRGNVHCKFERENGLLKEHGLIKKEKMYLNFILRQLVTPTARVKARRI